MWSFLTSLFGSGGPKWTPEERELFRQIALADPDDPAPRLRLAQTLEKRGEPMGEYIRLTHEAEAFPEGDPRRAKLDERLQTLLDAHGKGWCRPMKKLGLQPMIMGHFYPPMWMTHGVFDQLELDREGILPERAAEVFEAMPALRQLNFSGGREKPGSGGMEIIHYTPDFAGIADTPQMEQIGELNMTSIVVTLDDLRAIARSPHFKNLRVLRLQGDVGAEGARQIAGSKSLKRLRELVLHSAGVGDEGAIALASSPSMAGLVLLELGGIVLSPYDDEEAMVPRLIGPAGAAGLAGSAHLANLRTLSLTHNRLGPDGAKALAGSPHLRPKVLTLQHCRLLPGGGRALGTAAWLAGVAELNLEQNALGDEGVKGLAVANLGALTVLNLGTNEITGAGLKALASANLPALRELRLSINAIEGDGAVALATARMPKLDKLDLGYNKIGDAGAKALAGAAFLQSVTELRLNENGIGAAGVRALAASPQVQNLRELDLSSNPFGDEGADALAESSHFTRLNRLWASGANLTDRGEKRLWERFGDVVSM